MDRERVREGEKETHRIIESDEPDKQYLKI